MDLRETREYDEAVRWLVDYCLYICMTSLCFTNLTFIQPSVGIVFIFYPSNIIKSNRNSLKNLTWRRTATTPPLSRPCGVMYQDVCFEQVQDQNGAWLQMYLLSDESLSISHITHFTIKTKKSLVLFKTASNLIGCWQTISSSMIDSSHRRVGLRDRDIRLSYTKA